MKKLTFLLLISCFAINCYPQNNVFPNGVYLSLEQLKNKTPAFDANLQVIRRSESDIGFNGGNDYEIQSDIDSLNKKFIKKKMYAYVKNDSVFLNCIHHDLSTWYALCLTKGTYLAFKGAMSNSTANKEVMPYGVMFGAIGGGIAGANAAKKRFLYALSLRTGNARLLTREYLSERLKERPELLSQYNAERDQESESTLIMYINLLNKIIPVNSSPYLIPEINKDSLYHTPEGDTVYLQSQVDSSAQFLGGDKTLLEQTAKSVRYPGDAREKGIQGKVYSSFIVEKDGSISDIKIIRSVWKSLDDETLRVLNQLPHNWIAAQKNGHPVRMQFITPVNFVLK
jgi:TonB family protein